MKFNIIVTGGLYDSQAGYSALQFCHQAVKQGHQIEQVFFYQQGVTQATQLAVPLADEYDAHQEWLAFTEKTSVPLVACVAASEQRGILNQAQAQEHAKPVGNMPAEFTVAGLATLHAASAAADRTITFK